MRNIKQCQNHDYHGVRWYGDLSKLQYIILEAKKVFVDVGGMKISQGKKRVQQGGSRVRLFN
jgi:hypothetical protein